MFHLDLPGYRLDTMTIEPHYGVIRLAMALRARSPRRATLRTILLDGRR